MKIYRSLSDASSKAKLCIGQNTHCRSFMVVIWPIRPTEKRCLLFLPQLRSRSAPSLVFSDTRTESLYPNSYTTGTCRQYHHHHGRTGAPTSNQLIPSLRLYKVSNISNQLQLSHAYKRPIHIRKQTSPLPIPSLYSEKQAIAVPSKVSSHTIGLLIGCNTSPSLPVGLTSRN